MTNEYFSTELSIGSTLVLLEDLNSELVRGMSLPIASKGEECYFLGVLQYKNCCLNYVACFDGNDLQEFTESEFNRLFIAKFPPIKSLKTKLKYKFKGLLSLNKLKNKSSYLGLGKVDQNDKYKKIKHYVGVRSC